MDRTAFDGAYCPADRGGLCSDCQREVDGRGLFGVLLTRLLAILSSLARRGQTESKNKYGFTCSCDQPGESEALSRESRALETGRRSAGTRTRRGCFKHRPARRGIRAEQIQSSVGREAVAR